MKKYLEVYKRELKNRNYAATTVRLYMMYLGKFLIFSRDHSIDPAERIGVFLNSCLSSYEQRRLAWSSIKLFYALVLKKECPYALNRTRQKKRLPDLLSREDVKALLAVISNTKHRLMISMLYGSGLRVSEVCSIRIKDLDLIGLRLKITNSKGHKDRITLLSGELVADLMKIIKGRRGDEFLFVTQSGKRYSIRTVQKIFIRALSQSGLQKTPTCHTLRHCFATHLVENGIDIKTVKTLLGHKSIKTTMIYVKLADIRTRDIVSPL